MIASRLLRAFGNVIFTAFMLFYEVANTVQKQTEYRCFENEHFLRSVIGVNGSVIKVLDLAANTQSVLYSDPSQPMLVTSLAIDQVTTTW